LLLITGLLFSITLLQPNNGIYRHNEAKNTNKGDKQIIVTPLLAQVDNPFFNVASLFSSSLKEDVNKSLEQFDKTITDSVVKVSIEGAQIAMQKADPAMLATVSSGNWQKIMKQSGDEASKSLRDIDWTELQVDAPQLLDSSFILQSVNAALAKEDRLNEVNVGLATAKEQLIKLQQDKAINFNFSADNLQQLTANAFAAIRNINFKAIKDSAAKQSDRLNKLLQDQKLQQLQIKIKQVEWIKRARDVYKKEADVLTYNVPETAPLPPLPPDNNEMIYTCNEPAAAVADEVPPADDSWSFSEPVFHVTNVDKSSKTIHIISNTDSATINIVIEIRQ
jgi:hypothetical protein